MDRAGPLRVSRLEGVRSAHTGDARAPGADRSIRNVGGETLAAVMAVAGVRLSKAATPSPSAPR